MAGDEITTDGLLERQRAACETLLVQLHDTEIRLTALEQENKRLRDVMGESRVFLVDQLIAAQDEIARLREAIENAIKLYPNTEELEAALDAAAIRSMGERG